MDRREFFRRGISKVAEKVVDKTDEKISFRAQRWIRPPFAQEELSFLLSCTRCNACIDACSYKIIFPLSAKNGADVMQTPALDLLKNGCHLCDTWPCVEACEPKALSLPSDKAHIKKSELVNLLTLATVAINVDACIAYQGPECGACADSCVIDGALIWLNEKPSINPEKCTGCGLCREFCITDPKSITICK